MAIFCTNCGSAIKEGAAFCANCGTPARAAQAATPQPTYQPPAQAPAPAAPMAPRSGSPLMKVLLIVLAIIVGLGAMGIIGSIYVIHRVKQHVVTAARERGVDLSDSTAQRYSGRLPDPCSLLTTSEASSILGVAIERAESRGHRCEYFAHPVSDAERQDQVSKAIEALEAKDRADRANGDNPSDAARRSGVEELTKKMVASNAGNGPYFTIELNENGKAEIAGMKLAMRAVAGAMNMAESLSGIGDDAMMGPMDSMLVFTKNGLGVKIDLRQVAQGRDRAIAMAHRLWVAV